MNSTVTIHEYSPSPRENDLGWQGGARRRLFDGAIFSVQGRDFKRPDGRQTEFQLIESLDWVNICAIGRDSRGDECLLMVRQFRPGPGEIALEMPGGLCDPGESPLEAAKRELLEEAAVKDARFTHIGSACPNAALFTNTMHVFTAENLIFTDKQNLDENEVLELEYVPIHLLEANRVPEFCVNGVMLLGWYFFSAWRRRAGAPR